MRPSDICLLAAVGFSLAAGAAIAAPPKVNSFFPAGAQVGQSTVVSASGDFNPWPVEAWADRPGVSVTAEEEKGKLRVTVAPEAAPGVCWVRLFNAEGAAGLQPLVIGALPEIEEAEPNDAPDKPQVVESAALVNGRLGKSGDVDGFAIALKQGQTLVASVQANAILGSPMDSVLQVCQLVERRVSSQLDTAPEIEAHVLEQNHDTVGLDPRIVFSAPRDGRYLVRLFAFPSDPNSTIAFAGGDTYIYRLTLATDGFVDHALPLAASREQPTDATLFGWGLPESAAKVTIPAAAQEASPSADSAAPAFLPGVAGSIDVPRIDHACVVADDSARPDAPQSVEAPVTISGRLAQPGAVAAFAFTASKGQKMQLRVVSRELGFPLDGVLAVTDAAGKSLQETDDPSRQVIDPSFVFTPPADGEYRAVLRDLHGRGGLRFVYRLTIAPVQPDYALTLAADSFALSAGKSVEIPVTIDRREGFDQSITIQAEGLPAGVTCEPVVSEGKGGSAKSVKVVLKAADDAAAHSAPIRIEGRVEGAAQLVRSASFSLKTPFSGQHEALWLTVVK